MAARPIHVLIAVLALAGAGCQSVGPPPGPAPGASMPAPRNPSAVRSAPAPAPVPALAPAPRFSGPPVAGGAVAGGINSTDVGRALAPSDLQIAAGAELNALESGRAGAENRWSGGGASGSVVVGDAYQINTTSCRDYTHNVTAGGRTRTIRSTACRQPNGAWRSVGS